MNLPSFRRGAATVALLALLAGLVGADCPNANWPGFKPAQPPDAKPALQVLNSIYDEAQRQIGLIRDRKPEAVGTEADWAKVIVEALRCRDKLHLHGTKTCDEYWTRVCAAWDKIDPAKHANPPAPPDKPTPADFVGCWNELNHEDPHQ